ncbi:nucleotide sugar dehydrogenase [Lewinella sp. LCG006]|uniref:nucleotide sugar dehydrogenase n=1 Tax=Lewinella sp. LCG006 TaxID=3231911 RepID=UPI003460D7B1
MEKIAVLGIGKLGICMALHLDQAGYAVLGVDLDPSYVDQVNQRSLASSEPGVEEALQEAKTLRATTDIRQLIQEDIDVLFILVATPSTPEGGYDHSQIERVTHGLIQLGPATRTRHLVIGCTTMPGYCDQLAEKMSPFNYTVSYNPEFIAQGRIMYDLVHPDQVLIGEANTKIGERLEKLYGQLCRNQPQVHRMDRKSAEITKLATNCFLTTKISFANSIGDLATKAGADPDKILAAIGSDSRIGTKYLNYGFGFGGPCFPRDNRALGVFAEETDYELLIGQATDEVNRRHLDFQLQQWLRQYAEEESIVFESVTYKPDSILLVESQQLALAVALARSGRKVVVRERKVIVEQLETQYPGLFQLEVRR